MQSESGPGEPQGRIVDLSEMAEQLAGQGMVDFKAMFTLLRDLGYDRYITIEREIQGEKQTADILAAKQYFEQLISEIYP